jgi:hypothetical protein
MIHDRPPPRPGPDGPRWYLLFADELTERDYQPGPLDAGIAADIAAEECEATDAC